MIMNAEFDLSLVEINNKKQGRRFDSVRRGYDTAQVDAFLVRIASRIEALEEELHQFRVAAEVPTHGADLGQDLAASPAGDASDAYTKGITRLVAAGVREVEKMLAEAKAEAAGIVSEAGIEADRITRDAKSVATRSVDEARASLNQVEEDARRALSDVAERRRQMIEELRNMQEHLVSVAQDLDLMLDPVGPDTEVPTRSAGVVTGAGL